MSPELFYQLFSDGSWSREAVDLAGKSPVAHDMLREASFGVPIRDFDVRRVWLAVNDDQAIDNLFAAHREHLTPGDRQSFVGDILPHFMHERGRSFIRSIFRKWWALPLLEEERDALIRASLSGGIRDQAFYRALGPIALDIARREIWRYGWDGGWGPAQRFGSPSTKSPLPGLASRFDVLLEHVELTTDLRDACLTPSELAQLGTWPSQMGPPGSAFRRGLKHMFGHPAFEEFVHALGRHAFFATGRSSGTHGPSWSFTVLRLLHLQQILEAPRLSRLVRDPALVLVPDVALFVMGRDDVVFQPELRVLRGSDRRWRARWAETAGEAVSVMFLEDSVELDLGTLSRVPERTDRPTPDFMAGTVPGQNVVFESKGATNWRTHLKQRRHALDQLGKGSSASDVSWSSKGRAFACSLFAAEQGEDRSSLLHVDDPPFQFEQDFGEGWELRSRRDHAIAMLEAARLYELADDLARARRPVREQREVATFRLPGAEGQEEGAAFVGSYLPIGEWARSLRHPDPRECARVRMFVGVERGLYRSFEHERFPSFLAPSVDDGKTDVPGVPVVGMLPGEVEANGVYSVLGDGGFLALWFE
jgi:hypothetical protein